MWQGGFRESSGGGGAGGRGAGFFCGGAGPESVVDLRFKNKNRMYETDERLTFRGKLALNADDVYQMNYILEGAEEYE